MKKPIKTERKLSLAVETLRALSDLQLAAIAGGQRPKPVSIQSDVEVCCA